jgi:site-specific DNA-methyltransferase (adenine-specific)
LDSRTLHGVRIYILPTQRDNVRTFRVSTKMSFTLHHGDCLEVMPTLSHEVANMSLTDLPYGTTQNKWDAVIDFTGMWNAVKPTLKPNAAICLFGSQPFSSALVMSNPKMFRHEWIWIKNRGSNFANTVREPMKEHEQVLVFSNGQWTYNKQMQERTGEGAGRAKYAFNVPTTTTNYGKIGKPREWQGMERVPSSWQKFNTEVGLHPTQKPVELLRYLIRTYTNEGETVLDFTMGSGSTGVAALLENRNFIGIEKDENYFNIAKTRIEEASQTQSLFV